MNDPYTVLNSAHGLDVVGDIHGHHAVLATALAALGYEILSGTWRHPAGRKVLFLGDLIDRGPDSRGTVNTVRAMVEAGEAVCLMGNHELNAVHFATEHPHAEGRHLRPRSDKNLRQHLSFLQEYHLDPEGAAALSDHIAWMATLPLWVDLGGLRAVHACWSPDHQARLGPHLDGTRIATEKIWQRTATPGDALMDAAEVILKGAEIRLPAGITFADKDGHCRTHARLKWWRDADAAWADAVLGPPELLVALNARSDLPAIAMPAKAPDLPTFFGHYWFAPEAGRPWLAGPTASCLDFSIARPGGLLGVYRWDGEDALDAGKLIGFDCEGRGYASRNAG